MPIFKILGPKTLRFGIRDGALSVTYDWKDYKTFGPFLLADMLSEYAPKSLRFCLICKKLFFTTHYRKAYCSKECQKSEKAIKTEKDRIVDRLKSRKTYLIKKFDTLENAKIAQHLEDAGFIYTMREAGFSNAEIKRLVPTSGNYRKRSKK